MRGALRAPLLHFLVLGALLSAAWPGPRPAIVLSAADVARIAAELQATGEEPPDAAELDRLVARAVDEEILVREAHAVGRLRHDGVVTTRLTRLGSFLGPGGEEPPEASLRRARELGLDRIDPVIRRYLAERMRLALAAEADAEPPGEDALGAHLERRAERFRQPERLRLRHVFIRPRTGDPEGQAPPQGSGAAGDPFPQGDRFVASRAELDRIFGPGFSARLDPDLRGRFQGPLPSAHGLHWVWLDEPIAARLPSLDEVRSQVLQDLLDERRAAHLEARLAELRSRYDVRVEAPRP